MWQYKFLLLFQAMALSVADFGLDMVVDFGNFWFLSWFVSNACTLCEAMLTPLRCGLAWSSQDYCPAHPASPVELVSVL
jgi:hypothetical protein